MRLYICFSIFYSYCPTNEDKVPRVSKRVLKRVLTCATLERFSLTRKFLRTIMHIVVYKSVLNKPNYEPDIIR